MSYSNQMPLHQLDSVISETVSHIHDFTKSSTDFTRNRKLNAETTIKTILNMQGNSLNAELLDAFPDINDRMTASAFEQAKDKLQPDVFKHILNEYNQTDNPKLFGDFRTAHIRIVSFSPKVSLMKDWLLLICSKVLILMVSLILLRWIEDIRHSICLKLVTVLITVFMLFVPKQVIRLSMKSRICLIKRLIPKWNLILQHQTISIPSTVKICLICIVSYTQRKDIKHHIQRTPLMSLGILSNSVRLKSEYASSKSLMMNTKY